MRRHLAAVLLLAIGLWTGVAPTAGAASGEHTTDSGTWRVLAKLDHGRVPAISCATTSWCWSIAGGELLFSRDAGATWRTRTAQVPPEVDVFDAVDCPAAGVCYVTARLEDSSSAALVLTASDVAMAAVPGVGSLRSISCANRFRCLATDGSAVAFTVDGGATWRVRTAQIPAGTFSLGCAPTSSVCMAVGSFAGGARVASSENFGASWTVRTPPGATTTLFSVDCTSTRTCHAAGYYATGPAVAVTTDGGSTWTRQTLPGSTGQLGSMSCPTSDVCWAFGANSSAPIGFATVDGGVTWTAQSLPIATGFRTVVSCPTPTTCAAVARLGVGFRTDNAGAAWQPVTVQAALDPVSVMSCPSLQRCVAMSRDEALRPLALTSNDGGHVWTRHPLPANTGYVSALDCATAAICHAWAYTSSNDRYFGQSLVTSDGGQSWQLHRGSDVSQLGPADLSCVDAAHCVAVGAGSGSAGPLVRVTSDTGLTWQAPTIPAGATALTAVSCMTQACVIMGRTGTDAASAVPTTWRTVDLAATYTAAVLPPLTGAYTDVDCSAGTCVATGTDADSHGAVARSGNGGRIWAATTIPAGTGSLRTVACAPVTCVIAANDGSQSGAGGGVLTTSDSGQTWSWASTPPMSVSWPIAVTCVPTRLQERCLASTYGLSGFAQLIGSP